MDYILALSGGYFYILGFWWCVQTSKRYYFIKQRRLEFQSTVTFPCCRTCQKIPLEGILKLVFSIIMIVLGIVHSGVISMSASRIEYRNLHITTIFSFFFVAAIIDICQVCGRKLIVANLDYVILMLSFGIQGILYGFHIPENAAQKWTTHNLVMIASFACCGSVALEFKVRDQVFCPLLRATITMILGSWQLNSFFLVQDQISSDDVDGYDRVKILSMYFTWHCAINFITSVCVWLLVVKCYKQSYCPCMPVLPPESEPEGLFLENRVRCDYHFLDRLESDLD